MRRRALPGVSDQGEKNVRHPAGGEPLYRARVARPAAEPAECLLIKPPPQVCPRACLVKYPALGRTLRRQWIKTTEIRPAYRLIACGDDVDIDSGLESLGSYVITPSHDEGGA